MRCARFSLIRSTTRRQPAIGATGWPFVLLAAVMLGGWACDEDPVLPLDSSDAGDQEQDELPTEVDAIGDDGEELSTPCAPNPCIQPFRTLCRDLGNMVFCDCVDGYQLEGEECVPLNTDPCEPNPCTNTAAHRTRCLWVENGHVCNCDLGYREDQGLCCAANSHAAAGRCVCDEGWIEVAGVCVPDPNNPCSDAPCAGAGLHRNTCVADESEQGYDCRCDQSFEEQNGQCMPVLLATCPVGLSCSYGHCLDPAAQGEQCVHDGDCPGATASCNAQVAGGICLGCGVDADCPGSTECTQYNTCADSCSSDSDCPWGRCLANLCVQRQCADDADCPQSTICVDEDGNGSGLCWRWTCLETKCSPSNPKGSCSRLDERCIYGACVSSCTPNPCTVEPNKTLCAFETGAPICRCAEGYVADALGNCQSEIGTCPSGWACENGFCADRDADFFSCQRNADCGAGSCSPTLPSGTCQGCSTETDCPLGNVCLSDYCLRPCLDASDCHDGMLCRAGGYCGRKECSQPSDCPAPYVCKVGSDGSGTCQRPPC